MATDEQKGDDGTRAGLFGDADGVAAEPPDEIDESDDMDDDAEAMTDDDRTAADRISDLRDRLQDKETEARADQRAKARRIEEAEPETAGEKAAVKKRRTKEAASETKKAAADAKALLAAEFGVSRSDAGSLIERGSSVLQAAGDQLDKLDQDGDGDTDILDDIEEGVEAVQGGGQTGAGGGNTDEIEPPVGDVEDDLNDLSGEGIEASMDLDYPIEDDL